MENENKNLNQQLLKVHRYKLISLQCVNSQNMIVILKFYNLNLTPKKE